MRGLSVYEGLRHLPALVCAQRRHVLFSSVLIFSGSTFRLFSIAFLVCFDIPGGGGALAIEQGAAGGVPRDDEGLPCTWRSLTQGSGFANGGHNFAETVAGSAPPRRTSNRARAANWLICSAPRYGYA